HPDLGDRVRDGLLSLLQKELRDTSISGKNIKLAKEERLRVINQVKVESEREQQLRTAYERIEAQFQVFKSLMGVARIEEKTKQEVIQGMRAMDAEARLKGGPGVPQATQVLYRQALVNYHIRKNLDLRVLREERFIAVLLEIEKSHVPFPDEPPIHFPPL